MYEEIKCEHGVLKKHILPPIFDIMQISNIGGVFMIEKQQELVLSHIWKYMILDASGAIKKTTLVSL